MTIVTLADQIACVKREIGMRELPPRQFDVGNGRTLIIDARDAWIFEGACWTVRTHRATHYVYRTVNGETVHLHREIIGAPAGIEVDHRDGNGLNDRRSNLRLATRQQNSWNRRSYSRSGYLGVDAWGTIGAPAFGLDP